MRKKHKALADVKFIKIHAGINVSTLHILFNKTTSSRSYDRSVLPEAGQKVKGKIKTLLADGVYNFKSYYKLPSDVDSITHPRSNDVIDNTTHQRNLAIRYIHEQEESKWK